MLMNHFYPFIPIYLKWNVAEKTLTNVYSFRLFRESYACWEERDWRTLCHQNTQKRHNYSRWRCRVYHDWKKGFGNAHQTSISSSNAFVFSNYGKLINVLFIPYFCLLVFGILVTLLTWFFFHLAHLDLQNVNKDHIIFSYFCNTSSSKVTKTKKRKMRWTKHKIVF